jgi:glycine oxidase
MTFSGLDITVVGAGIAGLWQACELAYRGHRIKLVERTASPFSNAASQYAGAMLAPYCERDGGDAIVEELGLLGLEQWKRTYPDVVSNGTLVLAQARDRGELSRFAARTRGHRRLDAAELAALEPDLGDRYCEGLHFAAEAHVEPARALAFLLGRARRLGVRIEFGSTEAAAEHDVVVDCRGIAARNDFSSLRTVRGERAVVQTNEINLTRTVRLLHPRFPLYVVPWGSGMYMLGATVLETEDGGPVTLRSTLDLLGLAYALHPAFGRARVIALDAGSRPAFPDNLPRIAVRERQILVNGLYRHGFLLAPILAQLVADHLEGLRVDPRVVVDGAAAGAL